MTLPEPYKTFTMNVTFSRNSKNVTVGKINENSFLPDFHYPTAEKILDRVNPDSLAADQVPFVYDKPGVIEIILLNPNNASHPFHLHGHNFQILGIGDGFKVDKSKLNKINPIRRDTVTAPGNSWVVLRYVVDNPGVWGFHCHIEVSTIKSEIL
jgi:FtsP/CotA-like multicopper oxidase with cupredoxin domain